MPIQQMTRYRRIHRPFDYQFTVVTTVKFHRSDLKSEMFFLRTVDGRRVLLDDLDTAANGISFKIDRGSRCSLGAKQMVGFGSEANFDNIEIIRPGTKPLGGPVASDFEVIWRVARKPGLYPSRFSLLVEDIFERITRIYKVQYFTHFSLHLINVPCYGAKNHNLLTNYWVLSTSSSCLNLHDYFQYEFDREAQTKVAEMWVTHVPIRRRVSKILSGANGSIHQLPLANHRRADAVEQQESSNTRSKIPFLS